MILILIILIVIIAIGITVVMVTIGKTDITTITLTDIKKGLSSGISSVTSGTGLCPDGKIMFNNNCYSKKKKTDCAKFEIPDPATNFTSCKKLDDSGKKQKCIDEGKIFYNNKCLPKVDKEYCLNKGSFLKPDPETNETSCTEMSSDDIKNMCGRTEVFYQGQCKRILNEKDCSEKLFLELDETTKNTKCRIMPSHKKNKICQKSNKILYNNKCYKKIDDYYCKVNSTWEHPKERIFYAYADKNKNYTECRSPSKQEKIKQCADKGYNYDETNDKCLCPEGTEIRNGKCLSIKTDQLCFPKETATTQVANFKKPDPNDKLGCTDMNEQEKKDYCKYLNSDNTKFTYRNNKCMRTFTAEECKVDLTLPNYIDNEFYNRIFYKKPDASKDNTQCRLMTKAEEEIECKKPENNAIWVNNKCYENLKKPEIKEISTDKNYIKIKIISNNSIDLRLYTIKYKICKSNENYNTWINYPIKINQINKQDNSINLQINNLIHNTQYKIKLKLFNDELPDLNTPESNELISSTKCDNSIYTDIFCRTKDTKLLGPKNTDKYGIIPTDRKDSDVNLWPNIKIPNKNDEGFACGCRDFKDNNERETWCKTNIYPNFDFSNGRTVSIEQDKCKISPIPVGPVENLQASGLNVNQTIKNDQVLEPEFYRTDYPYRIKIYWEYPSSAIKDSGNEDDSIPHKYKIERKKKLDINWKTIHIYDLSLEVDYINLENTQDTSGNLFYNVYSESSTNLKFINCKTDCQQNTDDNNKLYCEKGDDTKIKCFSKNEFNKYYIKQKQLNESFSNTKPSKEFLSKFKKFIWIDGDYGLKSLFKPSEISNYNDETEKLEPSTKYLYRITPINISGEGVSSITEATTIKKRVKISDCDIMSKDDSNLEIDFPGFKKVPNEDQTDCITMRPWQRSLECGKLDFTVDSKTVKGIYDIGNKKCVASGDYILPGEPIIKNIKSTKNSIMFTIKPPTNIGSPLMTGYMIKWQRKNSNEKGRLYFNQNFSSINYNELNVDNEYPQKYTLFPSENTNHNSEINIIHKTDANDNPLKPATNYEYNISAISQSDLWQTSISSVTPYNDGGLYIGKSNNVNFTQKTQFSTPIDVPTLTKVINPLFNKITINISKFPNNMTGGDNVKIIEYKLVRVRYNMLTGTSDINSQVEFIIDFNTTGYPILKKKEGSTISITDKIEVKKNPDDSSVPKTKNKLFFIDSYNIVPFSKYNYKIFCKNNKYFREGVDNVYKWSEISRNIDIETPMKDHISSVQLTNNIIIKNKQKAPIISNPNYAYFTLSIDNIIDPNINHYSDFSSIYTQTSKNIRFFIRYKKIIDKEEFKNVTMTGNIAEADFRIPINTYFNIEFRSEFYGILNIPGRSSSSIYSIGTKNLNNQIITGTNIGLNADECLKYKETISDTYKIPFYFNSSTDSCKSRKISEYGNKSKLDEYCESKITGSKWWGKGEVNPCQIPQNGSWIEISLAPEFTNVCRDSTNKIKGDTRICLNTGGAAFRTIKKWKYNEPKFGGIPVDPSGNLTKSKDGLEAYLFEECNTANNTGLENCGTYCANRYGSLTANGLSQTGLSDANMNGNSYCSRGDIHPATKLKFNNCEVCGNPAGPEQGKEWIETTTCINGYNGADLNVIDCKYVMSDVSGSPITVETTPTDGNFIYEYDKWYQCEGTGATPNETMDSKFNGILDKTGKNFCDPPFIESVSSRGSVDSSGNQLSSSTTIYRPKYFKISPANCNSKNGGSFPLCSIKDTTPQKGWDNNVCGIKTVIQPIKCKRNNNEAGIDDIWSCTNTKIRDGVGRRSKKFTTDTYYKKRLNTGNTREIWTNNTGIRCKAKCEGPNNGLTSSSGYDKWLDTTDDDTPLNSIDFSTKCKIKESILPLYQEGIPVTSCNLCNGNNNLLKDQCIDGKYGPDSVIKCSLASKVDIGNVETGVISLTNQSIPTTNDFDESTVGVNITKNIKSADGETILDTYQTNKYTTANYSGTCPSRYCNYTFTTTNSTIDNAAKCRGDKKITGISCSNNENVIVNNSNCGNKNIGDIIIGSGHCEIEEHSIVNTDTGNVSETPPDTNQACNESLKQYYKHFKCTKDGIEIDKTYDTDPKVVKPINCYILNDQVSSENRLVNSQTIQNSSGVKNCTCTCNYENSGINVGTAKTGLNCTENGLNLCESCNSGTGTELSNNQCVCKPDYNWNGNKCVKDCIYRTQWSSWSKNSATGIKTRTREKLSDPENGGAACVLSESQNYKVNCAYTSTSWEALPDSEQKLGVLGCTRTGSNCNSSNKTFNITNDNRKVKYKRTHTISVTAKNGGSKCSTSYFGQNQSLGQTHTETKTEWKSKDDNVFPTYMRGKLCNRSAVRASNYWFYGSGVKTDNKSKQGKSGLGGLCSHYSKANKGKYVCFAGLRNPNDGSSILYYTDGQSNVSKNRGNFTKTKEGSLEGIVNERASNFPEMTWTECKGSGYWYA